MNHNHENNPTGTKVISVMNSIRKRVRESTESVQAIYDDLLCSARSTEWDDTTEVVKNKTRATYRRFFSSLQTAADNQNIHLLPDIIMMDFEKPAQTTATDVFSSATIRGCFFHFTQCIWRKVQSLGLVREFKENDDVRTLVRRAAVLPLVPLRQVEDMWLFAIENCEDDSQQIEAFKDYVTEQWVEGDKSLWNHYDNRGPRTTNHVEGWHHKINNKVNRSHPNIYALLEIIKKEQQMNEIKMLQFQIGGRQHPRKRKYRFVDSRLATLKESLESGEIDLYVYADSASQLIKLK